MHKIVQTKLMPASLLSVVLSGIQKKCFNILSEGRQVIVAYAKAAAATDKPRTTPLKVKFAYFLW